MLALQRNAAMTIVGAVHDAAESMAEIARRIRRRLETDPEYLPNRDQLAALNLTLSFGNVRQAAEKPADDRPLAERTRAELERILADARVINATVNPQAGDEASDLIE